MPLYYLNTDLTTKEFYTDSGTLRDVLKLAKGGELVRINYFLGYNEFTKKHLTIYHHKVSSDVKILKDWLPADLVLRFILDKHVHVQEFALEFHSGITVQCSKPSDLIIHFKEKKTIHAIFKAFSVPPKIQAPLITEPGSLFFTVQRTGEHRFYGYFKNISLWLNKIKLDKISYSAFYPTNMN